MPDDETGPNAKGLTTRCLQRPKAAVWHAFGPVSLVHPGYTQTWGLYTQKGSLKEYKPFIGWTPGIPDQPCRCPRGLSHEEAPTTIPSPTAMWIAPNFMPSKHCLNRRCACVALPYNGPGTQFTLQAGLHTSNQPYHGVPLQPLGQNGMHQVLACLATAR